MQYNERHFNALRRRARYLSKESKVASHVNVMYSCNNDRSIGNVTVYFFLKTRSRTFNKGENTFRTPDFQFIGQSTDGTASH
jgi:hypothetical protein